MDVIYIVIPLAILIAGIALAAFIWAVKSGQMDDLDTPPIRAALDDDTTYPSTKPVTKHDTNTKSK